MSLIFVTCYNKKLHIASGLKLVRSAQFFKNLPIETFAEDDAPAKHKIDQQILKTFLVENHSNIPEKYGGGLAPCQCLQKHVFACPNGLWNFSAYRWFHKVVTLYQTTSLFQCDYLIWIDCDSFFKRQLPEEKIKEVMNGAAIGYLHGNTREAIESGFLIFDFSSGQGQEIIRQWYSRYERGVIFTDHRWDDGFQLTKLLKIGRWKKTDLAQDYIGYDPASRCSLSDYFQHNKGSHAKKKVV